MQHYTPYLNWIDHQSSHMLDTLTNWANINSHAMNLEGLNSQFQAIKKAFSRLDGDMEELTLPAFEYIDHNGEKVSSPLGKALRITKRTDKPLKFFFNGHMDTVYGKNSPFQKVTKIDENTINGPGVADMKGGLVVLLTALEAFEKSPYAKEVGWEVLITPDEEIGSPGSRHLLEAAAKRNHLGFIFEPSFADGALVSERPGSQVITIIVRGKAAHAGRDFAKGKSAIYALAPLIVELEKLNSPERIVNVGMVQGGVHSANIVPDLAIAKVNIRANDIEQMKALKNEITTLIQKLGMREGITIQTHESTMRLPKRMDTHTTELFKWLTKTAAELSHTISLRPSGGVTDGNILSEHGLPTIDSLGVVGGEIHSMREYMNITSLVDRAKIIAALLMKIANGEFRVHPKFRTIPL